MGKGKKNRKQDDDDWEKDIDEVAKEAGIDIKLEDEHDIPVVHKKEKEKKGKSVQYEKDNDIEEAIENSDTKAEKVPSKAGFSALMMDNSESEEECSSEEEVITETKTKTKKKKDKKKSKQKIDEDEDIADILANLEVKDSSFTKGKKKKKKDQNDIVIEQDIESELNIEVVETVFEDESKDSVIDAETSISEERIEKEGGAIKTAAQKRAEKKEREKKKKELDKKKGKKKKKEGEVETGDDKKEDDKKENDKTEDDVSEKKAQVKQIEMNIESGNTGYEIGNASEDNSDGDEESSKEKKKKKKKKKKVEEESEKKKTKKPNKAAILKMQEALEEAKQEEERLRLEEEEKQAAFEKAEEERLEKLRLDQEKKGKKKQKEKEKKERLKKEGKLLTAAQKEQKRKAEAMLEAMRAQGIIVPNKEDIATDKPKKVMYGKKKKNPAQNQATAAELLKQQTVEVCNLTQPQQQKEEVSKEDIVDSWDAEDDVTDNWEADDNSRQDVTELIVDAKEAAKTEIPPVKFVEKQSSRKSSKSQSSDKDEDESSESEESESEDGSEDESSSEEEEDTRLTPEKIKERARARINKRKFQNEAERSLDKLRAPVICVLGHVDTGKTKILDKIRRTNVQDGEAGGITQQIGATNIPVDKVKEQTKMVKEFQEFDLKLPGLLVIDTPGHESFSNLRSRGSNLCDMAILVIDIMHGLEPQTIESINLLKKKKTPFVVALNKIDRLFEWKKGPNVQVSETIKKQKKATKQDFDERTNIVIAQMAEQGLNAALHYQNIDEKSFISLVPTSAHSGDGMGDLMAIICRLTQTRLGKKLAYSEELESTVMEVKALPGLGTTIDVILVNGRLKEGDTIITGGFDGAIVTQIRSVLTPQPMRELRVKAQYIHHQCLEAAQGAKLCAKDLEKVLAGSPVYVAHHPDEVDILKEEVEDFVSSSLKAIKVKDRGVYVQASTLGSLEALLEFLKTSKIPYCGVNIGPVHKRDIMRCSVMLEHEPMYAVVLAFDVKIERDAQEFADREGVRIFSAEIIYHLFDQFTAYCEDYKQKKRDEFKHLAVYPCKLRIMPEHIFNTRDPIVLGVNIEAGNLRLGTPLVVPSQNRVMIGFVTGIEANHKQLEKANQGQEVCVKIEPSPGEAPKLYGRHFTHEDLLVSKVNRESIDVMKQFFREDMLKSDWQLIIELKKLLEIL